MSLVALSRHGVEAPRWLCIGLSGVDAWKDRRAKTTTAKGARVSDDATPVADFGQVTWVGRTVMILFDTNVRTNRNVRGAREELKQHLIGRGALVEYVDLPEIDEINGIDDLHHLWGPEKTLEHIQQARLRRPSAWGAFRLRDDGVFYVDSDPDKDPILISGALAITAATRSAASENWGRLLEWHDADGKLHRWAMPIGLLSGAGEEYRRRLMDGGLYVGTGTKAREKLALYLQTTCPAERVTCVDSIGWHHDAFVLPDACIRGPAAEAVIYQTDAEPDHRLEVRGTVDQWREQIGRLCSGNSKLILAVSCAFAAPLLEIVGGESGGIHFMGGSSTGKTTMLILAGSVVGGGKNGYAETWRTTANGIEATASAHNDLLLVLDEIGQIDPKDAADVAYLLANGQGKTRMSRNIGLRRRSGWHLLFLSSGELTLADHSASAGKRTRGGAEVRLLNISADAGAGLGLFEDLHGCASGDAFADLLKERALKYYGAPIRAFLEKVAGHRAEIIELWPGYRNAFVEEHVKDGASGEVKRAIGRLALIAFAGEMATEWGITGWAEDEPRRAAGSALQNWMNLRGGVGRSDDDAAIRQVRLYIEAHGSSRFESQILRLDRDGDEIPERVINRVGYREFKDDGEYWILPESWRTEVCAGFNYRAVCHALDEKGYLNREKPSWMRKARVHDHKDTIWVYAIRASILNSEQ